jgi:ceramide glucosyltransferase
VFSSCSLFPSQFELLFCIHDDKDASIMCVRKLIEKYPNVDATIFVGGKKIGINPKINNMYPGYQAAKYDYVLISDSGIRSKNWSRN